jgi:2-oxoglutarate dehydrogenase E2 component (dihydrolipoamide succinyltransferase)
MAINVAIPSLGDSVAEAVLSKWLKEDGDYVKDSEVIAELETDKANVELPAPRAGVFKKSVAAGTTVKIGQVVGSIDEKATAPAKATPAKATAPAAVEAAPAVVAKSATPATPAPAAGKEAKAPATLSDLGPAARRVVTEAGIDPASVEGTGPNGRITKEDAVRAAAAPPQPKRTPPPEPATPATPATPITPAIPAAAATLANPAPTPVATGDGVTRTPMTKMRKKIAERLVAAQHTAAILTTFNEVDLTEVMALRARHKESFEKLHGVGLGFMSFFVRACCQAFREFPRVNGQIDGEDVLTFDHVHMGVAVSTERGLVVPVLRNAHEMSFAKIESEIKRVALAARDNKLSPTELSGGTFSITNGGVFGSLLSTPILNPPQSAILGMHTIQKRPVVVGPNDEIKVRSMMYLALSYDHRLIDGKESVSFLVRVKQLLEDPSRLLIGV